MQVARPVEQAPAAGLNERRSALLELTAGVWGEGDSARSVETVPSLPGCVHAPAFSNSCGSETVRVSGSETVRVSCSPATIYSECEASGAVESSSVVDENMSHH